MMSKLFGIGGSGKEGRNSQQRSSSQEGRGTKKGAAKQKVDKYMEEAFKAEFDDELDQKNASHQV